MNREGKRSVFPLSCFLEIGSARLVAFMGGMMKEWGADGGGMDCGSGWPSGVVISCSMAWGAWFWAGSLVSEAAGAPRLLWDFVGSLGGRDF